MIIRSPRKSEDHSMLSYYRKGYAKIRKLPIKIGAVGISGKAIAFVSSAYAGRRYAFFSPLPTRGVAMVPTSNLDLIIPVKSLRAPNLVISSALQNPALKMILSRSLFVYCITSFSATNCNLVMNICDRHHVQCYCQSH